MASSPDTTSSFLAQDVSRRTLNGSYLLACGIEDMSQKSDQHSYVNPLMVCSESKASSQESYTEDDEGMHAIQTSRWVQQTTDSKNHQSRLISVDLADRSLPAPADMSDGMVLCRICHDDDSEEALISPCFCSGSMGMLHMSCLERWLGASDTTKCEICQFQFSITKKRRPYKWYLTNKKLGRERQFVMADMFCCLCFAPSTIATTLACLIGASHFTAAKKSWEATSLILLATANLCFFVLWSVFALRRNLRICKKWKETYQLIRIKYNPPSKTGDHPPPPSPKPVEVPALSPAPLSPVGVRRHSVNTGGSPWPRRKRYSTSTPHKPSITAYNNRSQCRNIETDAIPLNIVRERVMRNWGLYSGLGASTPIGGVHAGSGRNKSELECCEMLGMTPIVNNLDLSYCGISSDQKVQTASIWRHNRASESKLSKTEQEQEGAQV